MFLDWSSLLSFTKGLFLSPPPPSVVCCGGCWYSSSSCCCRDGQSLGGTSRSLWMGFSFHCLWFLCLLLLLLLWRVPPNLVVVNVLLRVVVETTNQDDEEKAATIPPGPLFLVQVVGGVEKRSTITTTSGTHWSSLPTNTIWNRDDDVNVDNAPHNKNKYNKNNKQASSLDLRPVCSGVG